MKQYVLAIDQGTTSSRAIIFNKKSEIVAMSQMEFSQICPNNGWVEYKKVEIEVGDFIKMHRKLFALLFLLVSSFSFVFALIFILSFLLILGFFCSSFSSCFRCKARLSVRRFPCFLR